jgi:anti-sigma B factor antagonist
MEIDCGLFDIEEPGETMILTPKADMGELDHERLDAAMKLVLDRLNHSSVKNIILDFHKTDYFGSTAVGFLVRLWKTTCTRKGRMALCTLSEHEKEILAVMRLDHVWDLCASREEALRTVSKPPNPG